MKALIPLLLISLAPFAAFGADWPEVVDRWVAEAKQRVPAASMEELLKASEGKEFLIVDVREPHEYLAGHVPGAVNIPRGLLEFRIWQHLGWPGELQRDRPVLLYCQLSGRAALGARALRELGIENARWVDMRYPDWEAADHPVDF